MAVSSGFGRFIPFHRAAGQRRICPSRTELLPTKEVGTDLLRYFSEQWCVRNLAFSQPLTEITDGWETRIFHFRLRQIGSLPPKFDRSLTLRIFPGSAAVGRGRHEFQVQQYLSGQDYPVPEPVHWEESCDFFGGPFLIMETVPGPTFLQLVVYRPWTLFTVPPRMARAQAQLHAIPIQGFPARPGSLLGRTLREMESTVESHDLRGLTPGLAWLREHQPEPPAQPCIVHLDFHPLNLIQSPDRPCVVLDWVSADLGDPYADLAMTYVHMRYAPAPSRGIWDPFVFYTGRRVLETGYRWALARAMPFDPAKFSYYTAWAAMRRLILYAPWLKGGRGPAYWKQLPMRRLRPRHGRTLARAFARETGVEIHI